MQASGRSRKWKWLFWLLIVPALLFALYVWFVISWSYSTGERAGYIQRVRTLARRCGQAYVKRREEMALSGAGAPSPSPAAAAAGGKEAARA